MGRKLTPDEETRLLREATRRAHEAAQEIRDAIRAATMLQPRLVADFEAVHRREIAQLSNYFTEESNRASASLNKAVAEAQRMIFEQVMSGKAVFDRHSGTVTISWEGLAFDDQVPPPYPDEPTWKATK